MRATTGSSERAGGLMEETLARNVEQLSSVPSRLKQCSAAARARFDLLVITAVGSVATVESRRLSWTCVSLHGDSTAI